MRDFLQGTAQDTVREWIFRATAPIPDPDVQGAVFAAALIITDHLFNLLKG